VLPASMQARWHLSFRARRGCRSISGNKTSGWNILSPGERNSDLFGDKLALWSKYHATSHPRMACAWKTIDPQRSATNCPHTSAAFCS
jgi:hypothetical protein